jgi:hypothetical protein
MIIDAHTHVFADGSPYGSVRQLIAQMEAAGIDRTVCVPGWMDLPHLTEVIAGRRQAEQNVPNHLVYDAIARHPGRLYGFVCLNPKLGAAALQTLQEGFAHGCCGVKLAPLVHRFAFTEPVLQDVAAACAERGFPIYAHVLPIPGTTTADYAAWARRCPRTHFILGHMGFGPADGEAIDLAAELPNLYLETSLGTYLGVCEAVHRAGANKVIFGSEFPLSHQQPELVKVQLLDPAARPAVLAGNIARLLNIPFIEKG